MGEDVDNAVIEQLYVALASGYYLDQEARKRKLPFLLPTGNDLHKAVVATHPHVGKYFGSAEMNGVGFQDALNKYNRIKHSCPSYLVLDIGALDADVVIRHLSANLRIPEVCETDFRTAGRVMSEVIQAVPFFLAGGRQGVVRSWTHQYQPKNGSHRYSSTGDPKFDRQFMELV